MQANKPKTHLIVSTFVIVEINIGAQRALIIVQRKQCQLDVTIARVYIHAPHRTESGTVSLPASGRCMRVKPWFRVKIKSC